MAVSVKMGVDASGFKAGIQEAQNSVKTLDAALKMNEKQLKATGDAEIYMANKSKLLNKQMEEQKKVVANIQKQMAAMKDAGVDETSEAYQKLERSMYSAAGKMMDIQTQLNGLANSEQNAAKGATEISTSLGSINKKVSFDAVIQGIGSITGAMEKAAKVAVNLGKQIWENITDSADWADTTATMATKLGMDVEDYQRHQKVFDTVADITVKDWQNAKKKIQKAVYDGSDEQMDIFRALGVGIREGGNPRYNKYKSKALREWEDVFWDTAQALRDKVASKELTQDQADVYANAIFGKGWDDLSPIFSLGREGFTKALAEQNVVSEESVNKLAELNDELVKLKGDFRDLKSEVLAGLAPALQGAAETLDGLLTRLMEYLQSPEGQAALEKMGQAVSGLFEDLGKIDPEQVVEGFTSVFSKVVSGLEWMVENKDTLSGLLTAIVTGWGLAKLTGGALDVLNLINGLKGLKGAEAVAAEAGEAAGSSWGRAFAAAVLKAAPWLIGAYMIVNPSETGNNETRDANGNLIGEGFAAWDDAVRKWENGERDIGGLVDTLNLVSENFYNAREIFKNQEALNALDKYTLHGDKNQLFTALQILGYEQLHATDKEGNAVNPGGMKYLGESTVRSDGTHTGPAMKYIGQSDVPVGGEGAAEISGSLESSADAQNSASDAMNGAAQVMQGMPGDVAAAVAAAIRSVKLTLNFTLGGAHANGLSYVPYDGYLGVLHRGERVLTARENMRYTTNNYFGNVNLNNGLEIEALTESIDRRNRRQMAGFGAM